MAGTVAHAVSSLPVDNYLNVIILLNDKCIEASNHLNASYN